MKSVLPTFLSPLTIIMMMMVASTTVVDAQKCALCFDGEWPEFPDKKFPAENIQQGIETCGDLAGVIGFVDEVSDDCKSGRAVATFCGYVT